MLVKEINLYEFEELDEEAKGKAYHQLLERFDFPHDQDYIEGLERYLSLFHVKREQVEWRERGIYSEVEHEHFRDIKKIKNYKAWYCADGYAFEAYSEEINKHGNTKAAFEAGLEAFHQFYAKDHDYWYSMENMAEEAKAQEIMFFEDGGVYHGDL